MYPELDTDGFGAFVIIVIEFPEFRVAFKNFARVELRSHCVRMLFIQSSNLASAGDGPIDSEAKQGLRQ